MTAYVDNFQHGISCAEVVGGYSREKMYLLHAVVSTYESQDIIKLVCDIDPGAVINVFHTLNFVGGWWGGHVDEPMPTAVPDPDKPARMACSRTTASRVLAFCRPGATLPHESLESPVAFEGLSFAQIKPTKMKLSLFGRWGVSFYQYDVT